MSTQGNGEAAAAQAVSFGLVGGLGVLVVGGIMWCGRKMDENFMNACRAWAAQYVAARAESRANVQDIPLFLEGELELIAASNANLTLDTMSPGPTNTAVQQELANTISRIRTALENAQDATQVRTDTERELVSYRLKSEIEAARGLLPQEKIVAAEDALYSTSEEMREALSALQAAWKVTTDTRIVSTHQERKVRQLLKGIWAQLSTIDAMLQNASKAQNAAYDRQKQDIKHQIEDAQEAIDIDPAAALSIAEAAQQGVQALARSVSADTLSAWDATRRKILTIKGTLETLTTMMKEAIAIKLIDTKEAQSISRRITVVQTEAQAILESASTNVQSRLMLLNERVEILKADVFREIKTKQQRSIAQTVATTLAELGFHSSRGGQPIVQENGDKVRVVATRPGGTPNFKRDDKIVSFDISQEGNVGYDFSGYIGDTCLSEAKEIFAALRKRGIFILDSAALNDLRKIPTNSITSDLLQQERFAPHFVQNKSQAELAQRLKGVFERMKFATIQESVVGGCIDIEAFNGPIGYHVILPPDGSAQVFKNHSDVTGNKQDPIVATVAHKAEEVLQTTETDEKEKSKSANTWKQQIDMRKQQMSGQ